LESTFAAAKLNFPNIPLIDRENLANIRPARAVRQTSRLFCQPWTGEQQAAASTALTASPLASRLPLKYICLLKMNQHKTPHFAAGVIQESGILENRDNRLKRAMKKGSRPCGMVQPALGIWNNHRYGGSSRGIDFGFIKERACSANFCGSLWPVDVGYGITADSYFMNA
jgi:hypothetical protein